MVERGDIQEPEDDADLVKKLLRFFGVGTVVGWKATFGELQVAYRRSPSFKAAPEAVAAWARRGEIEASAIECRPFDRKRFNAALDQARRLTVRSVADALDELGILCASAGVALTIRPGASEDAPERHRAVALEGQGTHSVEPAAQDQRPLLVQLLPRGGAPALAREEAGVHRRGGRRSQCRRRAGESVRRDFLLPPDPFRQFAEAENFSVAEIKRFAGTQGVAPGIVVGRLQHDHLIEFRAHNDLKERIDWG